MRIARYHSYCRKQPSFHQESRVSADILCFLQRKGIDIGQLNGITLTDADAFGTMDDDMEQLHVDLLYTAAIAGGIPFHQKANRFLTALVI